MYEIHDDQVSLRYLLFQDSCEGNIYIFQGRRKTFQSGGDQAMVYERPEGPKPLRQGIWGHFRPPETNAF